jgi:large subunit ribosomal protein L9e
MRLVHAHFPINANVAKDGKSIEMKNFLGGREIHKVVMHGGVTVKLGVEVKDELIFEGNDNAMVSLMCSQVSQSCRIGTKDERKFLDGVYVSEKVLAQARE